MKNTHRILEIFLIIEKEIVLFKEKQADRKRKENLNLRVHLFIWLVLKITVIDKHIFMERAPKTEKERGEFILPWNNFSGDNAPLILWWFSPSVLCSISFVDYELEFMSNFGISHYFRCLVCKKCRITDTVKNGIWFKL